MPESNTFEICRKTMLLEELNNELSRKLRGYSDVKDHHPGAYYNFDPDVSPTSIKRTITMMREQLMLLAKLIEN